VVEANLREDGNLFGRTKTYLVQLLIIYDWVGTFFDADWAHVWNNPGVLLLCNFPGEADYRSALPLDLMMTTAFLLPGAVKEGSLLQSM